MLAAPAALLAQTMSAPAPIKPKALKAGDLVGLITPSTMVADPDRLAAAETTIKYFGLRSRMGKTVGKHSGYATSVDDRIADLHEMFRDPEVKAVFCIRGGFGSSQILDRIDYDLIRLIRKSSSAIATSPPCIWPSRRRWVW
jgi:muramoyltetrapeptide carboxypeptidase